MYSLNTWANRIKFDLEGEYNFVNSMGSCSVLAWWWLNEQKNVAECLIFNTDYQYMLCYWRNKFSILSQNTMGWLLSKKEQVLHII